MSDRAPQSETSPAPASGPRKHLSGPSYREFILALLKRKNARTYLEIGVHNGATLGRVECASIGVDPNFQFDRDPMGKKPMLQLFQMTSDEFFRDHDPKAIFGRPVDVAFLDGMHLFEYLLRDFINTERACHRDSAILLDDCLPLTIEMTARERRPDLGKGTDLEGWWTGDVWKVVEILREYRPELRIVPVDVQYTGSVVVSNLDPASTLLDERFFEIVDRYRELELTPERFEAYWARNAPQPLLKLIGGQDLSLYIRP